MQMPERESTPAWGERYVLAAFATDAVLLDLASGIYFRMNDPARRVCEMLLRGDPRATVEAHLTAQLGTLASEASRMVEDMLQGLATTPPSQEQPGPFSYRAIGPDYHLCVNGAPVLDIRGDGKLIRITPGAAHLTALHHSLRVAAPKLMFLQGAAVLHASACIVGDEVTAFCGVSGAGKTTTARAFSKGGWTLFSEDLIVIDPDSLTLGPPRAYWRGEELAHAWSREAATRARAGEIECSDLLPHAVANGRTIAMADILFLGADRRNVRDITLARPSAGEALVLLLASNFLGSANASDWRTYFERSAAIVRTTNTFRASVPDGIEPLQAAARRYIVNSTS
jgi:hypothetical protein